MTAVEFEEWVRYHRNLMDNPPKGKSRKDWYSVPWKLKRRIFDAAGMAFGVFHVNTQGRRE